MPKMIGSDNPSWKGGRVFSSRGYVLIHVGRGHHLANARGYAYEHRVVAEEIIGRRLLDSEIVHHKNGIKFDNSPENLQVFSTTKEHFEAHHPDSRRKKIGEPNTEIKCACGCGEVLMRFDSSGRRRSIIRGHNAARVISKTCKITASDVGLIVSRRKNGESGASIARSLGVARSSVNRLLKQVAAVV
jgi:hypothetical protein